MTLRMHDQNLVKLIEQAGSRQKELGHAPAHAQDQLTGVDLLYLHNGHPGGPSLVEVRYTSHLATTGVQMLKHSGVATVERQPLVPYGVWPARLRRLVISNDEGRFTRVYPTREERERVLGLQLVVAHTGGLVLYRVPALESANIPLPENPQGLVVYSSGGPLHYTAVAIPNVTTG